MEMVLCAKTLGRRPGCVVMNIGAVMFDRSGADPDAPLRKENQFYEPISAFDSQSLKLSSNPETLRWWKKQPSWQVVGEEFMNSNTTVAAACDKLTEFIDHHKPTKVWSNSPTFHNEVIRALYEKVGKQMPVSYRQEMDFRTLMDLVYVDRDERPDHAGVAGYPKQHAIGDAIGQARAVVAAMSEIDPAAGMKLKDQRWLMLDIETLGRCAGYGIMSIGASRFGAIKSAELPEPRNQFYTVINNFDMQNNGFKTDVETLRWWKKEPIWRNLSAEIRDSTTSVHKACTSFAEFIHRQRPDKVWANSPSFDVDMLRAMFARMNIDFPIAYRQEMDFRTVMELAYPNRDDRPQPELSGRFPAHHALGDSMEQGIQAQKALEVLGITRSADIDEKMKVSPLRASARI